MNKAKTILRSRTTYTVLSLAIINTVPAIQEFIPQDIQPIANMILSIATLYFKFSPSQAYGTARTDL